MVLQIDSDFDGGNIETLRVDGDAADLAIRPDSNGPWYQWFFFRARGYAGRALTFRIVNAAGSAYPGGWPGYRACVSDDRETWRRTETEYANGVLTIRSRAASDEIWVAYFAPYDLTRLGRFLDRAATLPGVALSRLGRSVEGREISSLALGGGPRHVWLIGRQHSGETMASWWTEGAFDRLVGTDPVAMHLRQIARIHLVPLVNIDGAAHGNLRGNAAGLDLNRQWHGPDVEKAPEIAAVLAAMDRAGVDLCLDVHGDETLPHVFVDGCDSDPASSPAQVAGVAIFKAALLKASSAFQTKVGYPVTYGGEGGKGMCNRAVARRFGAVGLTLEMPFKDSLEAPDPVAGWSPAASARLGRDSLDAILAVLERM